MVSIKRVGDVYQIFGEDNTAYLFVTAQELFDISAWIVDHEEELRAAATQDFLAREQRRQEQQKKER
jgi:hypothetical protein